MSGNRRVVFVLQDTGKVYGAERATLDLARGLITYTPIECLFILIRETRLGLSRSDIEEELKTSGYSYATIPIGTPFSLKLVYELRKAFAKCDADCLHTVGYKATFHCALADILGHRYPWISTVHGWLERQNVKEKLYKKIEIRSLKRASRVVVLSTYYYKLLRSYGFSTDRLQLIPSGIDRGEWASPKLQASKIESSGSVCVGILGRLSDEKNHSMLLRVAQRLIEEKVPVRFLIAGDGPLRSQLSGKIKEKSLGDHISMPGMMDRRLFFEQCHILVSCSRIENLPYSIIEAMECALPVIATNVGGIPDLVINEKNGILVAFDDDKAMATGLKKLILDRAYAAKLGVAGCAYVKEHFSLVQSSMRHFKLYSELIERRERIPNHFDVSPTVE